MWWRAVGLLLSVLPGLAIEKICLFLKLVVWLWSLADWLLCMTVGLKVSLGDKVEPLRAREGYSKPASSLLYAP
jgi:hypothetical protein